MGSTFTQWLIKVQTAFGDRHEQSARYDHVEISQAGHRVDPLNKCHNLYIDEKGRLFLSGCNINNGGVLIFDGASAPGTPLYLGGVNTRYSHDNFTRNDTLWSADVYLGEFSVADVSNPRAPRLLATQPTSSRFTHNCWLSDDGKYLFTTDEKTFGTVDAFDVSNIDDIEFLDRFSPKGAKENRAIPHNTHYHKGFLATSWYTEGVVLTDAHRPQNLIETGRYDTYPQSKQGFEGCWGAYPYLPSGLLLASDISTGLYVLQPHTGAPATWREWCGIKPRICRLQAPRSDLIGGHCRKHGPGGSFPGRPSPTRHRHRCHCSRRLPFRYPGCGTAARSGEGIKYPAGKRRYNAYFYPGDGPPPKIRTPGFP
ncbi:MAG: choice-of-anchor B family protein [Haliscomenobacter sp.]|nr:choice-of-anchor B family protein [Haliscomenobacter sp.]